MNRINDRNYPGYSSASGRDPYGTAGSRDRSGGSNRSGAGRNAYGTEDYRSRQDDGFWSDDFWDDAGSNDNWDDDFVDDFGDDFGDDLDDGESWESRPVTPSRNDGYRSAREYRDIPQGSDYRSGEDRTFYAAQREPLPGENRLLDIIFSGAAHITIIMGLNLLVLLVIDLFFNQAMNFLGNRFFKLGCILVIICGMVLAVETIRRVRKKDGK